MDNHIVGASNNNVHLPSKYGRRIIVKEIRREKENDNADEIE